MPAIRPAPRNTDFEQPALGDPSFGDFVSSLVYDSLYHSPVGTLGLEDGPKGGIYRWSEALSHKYYGDGEKISPQEANRVYGLDGELNFTEPVYESYAQLLQDRKLAEVRREYELASGSTYHWGRRITGFGVSIGATILDPVNLASMFVPVVGESRAFQGAQRATGLLRGTLQRGLISPKTLAQVVGTSPTTFRFAKGAIEGLVGAGLVEPFNLIPALQEQANYDYKDSLMNLLFGAAAGGSLHAVGGYLGDKFTALLAGLKKADPQTHEAATLGAVSDLVQDRPVTTPEKLVSLDSHVVESEMRKVNTDNIFRIAEDQLDRFEQLRLQNRLTPEMEVRRNLLSSMLENRTSATAENLAAMFNMKLNEGAVQMPPEFSFLKTEPGKYQIPGEPVPLGPEKPVGTITGDDFRTVLAKSGNDLGKTADALTNWVQGELDAGKRVVFTVEDKPVNIVEVDRGMMKDEQGQRWGTMTLAMDKTGKNRVDVYAPRLTPSPEQVQTKVQEKLQALSDDAKKPTPPVKEKPPTDEAVGLKEPVAKDPKPIFTTLSPEEEAAEKADLEALQGDTDELEKSLDALDEPTVKVQNEQMQKIQKIKDGLEKWADGVVKEQMKRLNAGLDPEFIAAVAVKGAALFYDGVRDFAAWSKQMIEQFGNSVKPHLQDLHAAILKAAGSEKDLLTKATSMSRRRFIDIIGKVTGLGATTPMELVKTIASSGIEKGGKQIVKKLISPTLTLGKFSQLTGETLNKLFAGLPKFPEGMTPEAQGDLHAKRIAPFRDLINFDFNPYPEETFLGDFLAMGTKEFKPEEKLRSVLLHTPEFKDMVKSIPDDYPEQLVKSGEIDQAYLDDYKELYIGKPDALKFDLAMQYGFNDINDRIDSLIEKIQETPISKLKELGILPSDIVDYVEQQVHSFTDKYRTISEGIAELGKSATTAPTPEPPEAVKELQQGISDLETQVKKAVEVSIADQEIKNVKQLTPAIEAGVNCMLKKVI